VSAAAFRSKSRNTPFDGWPLRGVVAATIVGGRVLFVNPAVAQVAGLAGSASR
jgi:dihydroorotase